METMIAIKHCTVAITAPFENFTGKMQSLLGRIIQEDFERIAGSPETAREHLTSLGGFEDLILFGTQEHGALLRLAGQQRKAVQYIIGNPQIALQMTRHDIRAALYTPLRLLVYECGPGKISAEYDLPSSLFGQFNNSEILQIGLMLNRKLEKLIEDSLP